MMMNGITSLDGHGKSSGDMNKAMERMSIVFKGRLSPDQLEAIKQDIQSTVMAPMAGDMLSNAGEKGDTMMAHMSPDMMGMAQEMNVLPDGNVNPMTGLPAFNGDNPGQDPDEGGPAGQSSGGGGGPMGGYGGGPAGEAKEKDAKEKADAAQIGYTEAPMDYHKEYTELQETMSKADFNRAKMYGLMSSIPTMQALSRSPDRAAAVDAVAAARHSHDPSMSQLDLNDALDRGFRMENPGTAAMMGGLSMIGGFMPGPIGAVMSAGNLANHISGSGNTFAGISGIPTGDPDKAAGLQANLDSIMDQAAKDESDIQGSRDMDIAGGGEVDFMNFEPDVPETEPEADPDLGVDAERAALLGMGYSPADATTIIENFGSLDTFKQRFEGRFGTEPTPGSIANPSAREFIQVPRGRPVGIGSIMT